MKGLFKINGIEFPMPSVGLTASRTHKYEKAETANGTIVAQKINRPTAQYSNLMWQRLTYQDWHNILVEFEKMQGVIEIFDPVEGAFVSFDILFEKSSEDYLFLNEQTGEPIEYANCSLTFIDMNNAKR